MMGPGGVVGASRGVPMPVCRFGRELGGLRRFVARGLDVAGVGLVRRGRLAGRWLLRRGTRGQWWVIRDNIVGPCLRVDVSGWTGGGSPAGGGVRPVAMRPTPVGAIYRAAIHVSKADGANFSAGLGVLARLCDTSSTVPLSDFS